MYGAAPQRPCRMKKQGCLQTANTDIPKTTLLSGFSGKNPATTHAVVKMYVAHNTTQHNIPVQTPQAQLCHTTTPAALSLYVAHLHFMSRNAAKGQHTHVCLSSGCTTPCMLSCRGSLVIKKPSRPCLVTDSAHTHTSQVSASTTLAAASAMQARARPPSHPPPAHLTQDTLESSLPSTSLHHARPNHIVEVLQGTCHQHGHCIRSKPCAWVRAVPRPNGLGLVRLCMHPTVWLTHAMRMPHWSRGFRTTQPAVAGTPRVNRSTSPQIKHCLPLAVHTAMHTHTARYTCAHHPCGWGTTASLAGPTLPLQTY
jgi:hypothetical protein